MIDYKEVQEYIEKKNDIELTDTQILALKAIIRGDITYIARQCGRSLLYDGYADYLKSVVGSENDYSLDKNEYDSVFTIDQFKDEFKRRSLVISDVDEYLERMKTEFPVLYDREFICKNPGSYSKINWIRSHSTPAYSAGLPCDGEFWGKFGFLNGIRWSWYDTNTIFDNTTREDLEKAINEFEKEGIKYDK